MEEENKFSLEHTLLIKGIAILVLCWHHLYWHNVTIPVELQSVGWLSISTVLTKVCVPLFTLLSGFGINESYRRKGGKLWLFSLRHIKKILVSYWWVYIPAFLLSFRYHISGTPLQIYGDGGEGVRNFLLDFFGVRAFLYTPTLNNTWWYIEAVLVFYLCFPLLWQMMKKVPLLPLILSAVPVLYASTGVIWEGFITTDRELFYLFPFVAGMYFSEYRVWDRLTAWCGRHRIGHLLVTLVFLAGSMYARTQMLMITDVIYALALVMLGIWIASFRSWFQKGLMFLGRYSMDIYLVHSFLYFYFGPMRDFLANFQNVFLKYGIFMLTNIIVVATIRLVKFAVRKLREKRGSERDDKV